MKKILLRANTAINTSSRGYVRIAFVKTIKIDLLRETLELIEHLHVQDKFFLCVLNAVISEKFRG